MFGIELTVGYVVSQVFAVAEYVLLGASYLAKKRKMVVLLDIASMICGIVTFLILGADLGLAMSVIILLANFYYLWDEHQHNARERAKLHGRDYVVLGVVLAGIAVVTWLTYDGPLSLLSVAATMLYEISIWQKSTKMYKFLGIPVALCWTGYNLAVLSIFGALCEVGMLSASVVGYVREVKKSRRAKRAGEVRRERRAKEMKKCPENRRRKR